MAANFQLILDTAPPRISLSVPSIVAENDIVTAYINSNEDLDVNLLSLFAEYPNGSNEDLLITGAGSIFTADINLAEKGLGILDLQLTAYDTVWNKTTMERSVSVLPVVNRVVTIGGEPVTVIQNSLNLTDRINSRSTASFTVFFKR